MKFKSGIMQIGNTLKKVVVINHKEEAHNEETSVSCLHHIHILDRSGSMSREISQLIENVKHTIDFMSDNDFISVIWFASAGQYKTLIKGARKDESIKLLLDSIKSTLGCTCFSDPLREVGEIIEELSPICPNFNVTLFTDGEPVTPWSEQEEERKIHEAINLYSDKVIAINTVGYSNYYNKELLTAISQRSEFGQMIHSSQINEYADIFSHNYERIKDLVIDPVEITAANCDILYLGTNNSKLMKDDIKFNMLEKKKNQFAIIAPDTDDFDFEYQGERYNSGEGEKLPMTTMANILYGYAYENYYVGYRDICLDILCKNLGDKAFVDAHMSAFTKNEVGNYMKALRKAVFKPKYRFAAGECTEDYLPAEDATCVFDVLRFLCDNGASYVYSSNYNRVGRKSEDTFNLFTWDDKVHKTRMSDLVFNDKELNVSIRSKISGTVTLNPNSASKVGLPETIRSYVYRNQTIIKDGNLNMDSIEVVMGQAEYKEFTEKFPEVTCQLVENGKDGIRVIVTLSNLPVINKMYANVNCEADYILDKMSNKNENTLKLKVIAQKLSELEEAVVAYTDYTDEQYDVLKEHGVDKKLCYNGVKLVTAEKNEDDFYMARQMEFAIKGGATLPSYNAVMKKVEGEKKLNAYDQIICDENESVSKYLASELVPQCEKIDFLKKEKQSLEKNIRNDAMDMCIGRMATVLTGGWIKGVQMMDNDKYFYEKNGTTLLVTAKRIKKFF